MGDFNINWEDKLSRENSGDNPKLITDDFDRVHLVSVKNKNNPQGPKLILYLVLGQREFLQHSIAFSPCPCFNKVIPHFIYLCVY